MGITYTKVLSVLAEVDLDRFSTAPQGHALLRTGLLELLMANEVIASAREDG